MTTEAGQSSLGVDGPAAAPLLGCVVRACEVCGLVQWTPRRVPAGNMACCARCGERLSDRRWAWGGAVRRRWTRALAASALILYPAAMSLPVMRIERFGHSMDTTIWGGVVALINDNHVLIGLVVLVCSVVVPVFKLLAMLVLSSSSCGVALLSAGQRHTMYRLVEFLGRWGMLDVLLIAVLIAAIKLGDLMSVHAGPGVLAFGGMVVLSLGASACFDPRSIWHDASREAGLEGEMA